MPSSETKALPSTTTAAGSTTEEMKPKCKACCACPETKQVRDACIMENGEANCQDLIEAHKKCMREQGFKIWFSRAIILPETKKQSDDFVMRVLFSFFRSSVVFFYVLSCFCFPFVSVAPRVLLESEVAQLARHDSRPVTDFKRRQLQNESAHWDKFYKRNADRFFKDRHWMAREFPELSASGAPVKLLEVGCGVGNLMLPLLDDNPAVFVYACDFAPTAIAIIQVCGGFIEKNCLFTSEFCIPRIIFEKCCQIALIRSGILSRKFEKGKLSTVIMTIHHIAGRLIDWLDWSSMHACMYASIDWLIDWLSWASSFFPASGRRELREASTSLQALRRRHHARQSHESHSGIRWHCHPDLCPVRHSSW